MHGAIGPAMYLFSAVDRSSKICQKLQVITAKTRAFPDPQSSRLIAKCDCFGTGSYDIIYIYIEPKSKVKWEVQRRADKSNQSGRTELWLRSRPGSQTRASAQKMSHRKRVPCWRDERMVAKTFAQGFYVFSPWYGLTFDKIISSSGEPCWSPASVTFT